MPRQAAWFHQLPGIIEVLHGMRCTHLDRRSVERLMGVAERRARQIMAGLPGMLVGNAFAVDRTALLERLEAAREHPRFQWETARRARLDGELERARRERAGRGIRIPASLEAASRRLHELPREIRLRPGELSVAFRGAPDLAAKLFELSQALANDWESFCRELGEGPAPPVEKGPAPPAE